MENLKSIWFNSNIKIQEKYFIIWISFWIIIDLNFAEFSSIQGVGIPMAIEYNEVLEAFVWQRSNLLVDSSFWDTNYPDMSKSLDIVVATNSGLRNGYTGDEIMTYECFQRNSPHNPYFPLTNTGDVNIETMPSTTAVPPPSDYTGFERIALRDFSEADLTYTGTEIHSSLLDCRNRVMEVFYKYGLYEANTIDEIVQL